MKVEIEINEREIRKLKAEECGTHFDDISPEWATIRKRILAAIEKEREK